MKTVVLLCPMVWDLDGTCVDFTHTHTARFFLSFFSFFFFFFLGGGGGGVDRMWSPEPDERPTAAEVAQELGAIMKLYRQNKAEWDSVIKM